MTTAVLSATAKELTSYQKITADPKRIVAVALIIISILAVVLTISYKEYYWSMLPLATFCLATCYLIWNMRDEPGFKLNLRTIPSLILLAVCVIGVITALLYHQHYLTIPFLVGLLAAAYTLTLAFDYENLKNFSAEIDRLEEVRVGLSGQVNLLEKENTTLKTTSDSLSTQVRRLESEQWAREAQINVLSGQVTELERTKTRLAEITKKLNEDRQADIGKLRDLHQAIQSGGTSVLNQFGDGMNLFADLLLAFEGTNHELATISEGINQKTAQGIYDFAALAVSLRTVAKGVESYIEKHGEVVNALPAFIDIEKRMAATQTKYEMLVPIVNRLQGLEEQQQRALGLLSKQLDQASGHATDLEATKRELATIKDDLLAGINFVRTNIQKMGV